MSSHRATALLGPLIAVLLLAGVLAVVLRGPDGGDADFAEGPSQTAEPAFDDPGTGSPDPSEPSGEDGSELPEPGVQAPDPTDGGTEPDPDADATAEPDATADPDDSSPEPTPEPSASPDTDDGTDDAGLGGQVAVDDPTGLTGGWEGGTPNTGTAVSAVGLGLLLLGAGLLWLRRSRA